MCMSARTAAGLGCDVFFWLKAWVKVWEPHSVELGLVAFRFTPFIASRWGGWTFIAHCAMHELYNENSGDGYLTPQQRENWIFSCPNGLLVMIDDCKNATPEWEGKRGQVCFSYVGSSSGDVWLCWLSLLRAEQKVLQEDYMAACTSRLPAGAGKPSDPSQPWKCTCAVLVYTPHSTALKIKKAQDAPGCKRARDGTPSRSF